MCSALLLWATLVSNASLVNSSFESIIVPRFLYPSTHSMVNPSSQSYRAGRSVSEVCDRLLRLEALRLR
uniref:Secreted protein n=1 Tax=Anguilla anguilla TaxID=7936 RepID=A0A0E9W120_ANGAN